MESVINLVVSLIAVNYFGIYGVLLGTIAALLYRSNDIILYANKRILQRGSWNTYRRWILDLLLYGGIVAGGKWLLSFVALDSYVKIFFWASIACIIVLGLYFAVVSLFDREAFGYVKEYAAPKAKAVVQRFKTKKS